MLRKICKGVAVFLCCLQLWVIVPVHAENSLADFLEGITAECFTQHESPMAVTRDLMLDLTDLPEGAEAEFVSGDTSVLTISGDVGAITRDAYAARNVVLTLRLQKNGTVLTKDFVYTVLSASTHVYASESFYYPSYANHLVTDVQPIANSVTAAAVPSSVYGSGWMSAYPTELTGESINAQRFKTVLKEENGAYGLYSYRSLALEEYNYTRYLFGDKPTGKTMLSMRLKCNETEPQQIYLFQLWANYLQADGSLKRARPVEIQLHRRQNDGWILGNGENMEDRSVPEGDTWFTLGLQLDLEKQLFNVYLDGVKLNEAAISFYEKGAADRTNCMEINDFQFNSYRKYGGGALWLDDFVVMSDNSETEKNQYKLHLADALEFSAVARSASGQPIDADHISENFSVSVQNNEALSAFCAAHNLSVGWESGNEGVISFSQGAATVTRGALTQAVKVTACIEQNSDADYVKKDFLLTVPCADGAEGVDAAYRALREEALTTETADGISRNLTLPLYEDASVSWTSSRPEVLTDNGTVLRGVSDCDVDLTAHITSADGQYSVQKTLHFTVLSADTFVYAAENFYHPAALGQELSHTSLSGWRNVYTAASPRLYNTVQQETDGNYVMRTDREEANLYDYNFCNFHFKKALEHQGSVYFKFRVEHSTVPQIYILQLSGKYRDADGALHDAQIAEIQLHYQGSGGRIQAMMGTHKPSPTLLHAPPQTHEWHTAQFTVDNHLQTYDFYLDGQKLNRQPLSYYTANEDVDFAYLSDFSYNTYRAYGGGCIMIDDVCVTGRQGTTLACHLYDGGTIKARDAGEIVSGSMKAKVLLYNGRDQAVSGTVFLAAYQNDRLLYVQSREAELAARASAQEVTFSELSFPYADGTEVKAFFEEASTLSPHASKAVCGNRLEKLQAEAITDADTGRSYQMIRLFGSNSVRGYFTMQGWSANSEKFYFWDEDFNIYEFDTAADRGRFIDRALGDYAIITTPYNHLFYINRNREIIKMDCSTYQKTKITDIPPEYCTGRVSMLQVNNDESRLSVDWKDVKGDIDPERATRFPVYDITDGTWLLETSYGFETPQYAPNHLNINPAPDKSNLVLFAHEGNYIHDRIWVMDIHSGKAYNAFSQKRYSPYESGETAGHETWTYDGKRILFAKSGKIGYGGAVTVGVDGTDRRYINSDYSYLHIGASPVSDRWIVGDTSYNGSTTQIVLTDCYTGDSYLLATVRQTGENPGHSHPAFSQDGQKVWFGLYDSDETTCIGWMDISDIINSAPEVSRYVLSENCTIETAERSDEVQRVEINGVTAYQIPANGVMRVQADTEEKEDCAADITVSYLDDGTGSFALSYFVWEVGAETNALNKKTVTIQKTNTGVWQSQTISLAHMNLENMERLGADFILQTDTTPCIIGLVSVAIRP